MPHAPVLLKEVIEYLDPQPGEFMIDGTLDGGGHARAILERIGPTGMFLGVDWDPEMIAKCQTQISNRENTILSVGNYAKLAEIMRRKKLPSADGLLLDLGFSSEQLAGRGFSFGQQAAGEPLRMTYSPEAEPVQRILRRLSENELADIIREFGGERFAGRIAKAIKAKGKAVEIRTSGELAEAVRQAVPRGYERGRIDPATRTFQALRIYANAELDNLAEVLASLPQILKPGGRAVIISFHSLEDRLVKQAFRQLAKAGQAEELTRKPVTAALPEKRENPRSRSAKLRSIRII